MMCHLKNKAYSNVLLTLLTLTVLSCGQPTEFGIGEERVAPNESDIAAEMIRLIKKVSLERKENDAQGLVRRFNQAKTIACTHGEMEVLANSQSLAVGLFSTRRKYPVTLRFANATKADDRESDLRGLSIRVMGVNEASGAGGTPAVQDFTLNSFPSLFAGTPEHFLSFVKATAADQLWWYLATHPKSLWIGFKGRGNPTSPLNIQYFSTTPYLYGEGSAVKYGVQACDKIRDRDTEDNEHYLRAALQTDLSHKEQCLNFQVQFQSDVDLMPMEDASVTWPEAISPFVTVAKIILPAQNVIDEDALAVCEQMMFNPWNALPSHQPLGGVNRVRQRLYREIGLFRAQQNEGTR